MVQIESNNSNNSYVSWTEPRSSRHFSLISVIITSPQRDRDDNNSSLLTHTDHSPWLFKQPANQLTSYFWSTLPAPEVLGVSRVKRLWRQKRSCSWLCTYFFTVEQDDPRAKEAYIAVQMVTRKILIQPIYMSQSLVQNSKSLINCLSTRCSGPNLFPRSFYQLSLPVFPIFFFFVFSSDGN